MAMVQGKEGRGNEGGRGGGKGRKGMYFKGSIVRKINPTYIRQLNRNVQYSCKQFPFNQNRFNWHLKKQIQRKICASPHVVSVAKQSLTLINTDSLTPGQHERLLSWP